MLKCDSFISVMADMKYLISAVFALLSCSVSAESMPIEKGKSMTFECQTGVKVHVIDDKRVVINGDFDADIIQISSDRLQASGQHGYGNLSTSIDLRFMGNGYFSLLTAELDSQGFNEPWKAKVINSSAVICQRSK